MDLTILDTDRKFKNSPDAGPDCLCSRCGKPILGDTVLRAWNGAKKAKDSFEWRYHFACQGFDARYDLPSDPDEGFFDDFMNDDHLEGGEGL